MKAVEYYSKAGNVGHAMVCLSAGQMYEDGRKIAQNYSDAAKWYRKAADLIWYNFSVEVDQTSLLVALKKVSPPTKPLPKEEK